MRDSSRGLSRREALGTLGAAVGAVVVGGCDSSPTSATETPTANPTPTPSTASAACAVSPNETAGPYPSLSDFVRADITEGKAGLPVTLTITVVNAANACSPVANASVEIWQCDADGRYSQYNQPGYNGTGQSFLRGIQTTDANGRVVFNTVYPGWYAGRATHIHVEVTVGGRSVKVTQIAFPENVTAAVYATGVYAVKGQNPTSNASDNVFADSVQTELATLVGSPTSGYTATYTVGVSL